MEYTDALGRTVALDHAPMRIVSLVPSLTEALFAFGIGERVVGVTRFCVEPADGVLGKVKVGGTKDIDAGRVLSLDPDLVIANQEENTRADVEALVAAGLPVFVTFARTVAEAVEEMRSLAEMCDARSAAAIIAEAEEELERAVTDAREPVRVFCPIWRKPWMTINRDTYIHDMLRLCGGRNIFADSEARYPEIDLAEVAAMRPDVVLLPDEPYPFAQKHVRQVIEAVGDVRIYLVDGKYVCWYGPRIPEGIRVIRRMLRGEAVM